MPGGATTVTVGDTVRLAVTATFVDSHWVDPGADHVEVSGRGARGDG